MLNEPAVAAPPAAESSPFVADITFPRGVPIRDDRRKIMSSEPREPGRAADHYMIDMQDSAGVFFDQRIDFQSQPEPEGINGVTIENLLEICADRLSGFQSGPFACDANARALDMINGALISLYQRTDERRSRGVEGKLEA